MFITASCSDGYELKASLHQNIVGLVISLIWYIISVNLTVSTENNTKMWNYDKK